MKLVRPLCYILIAVAAVGAAPAPAETGRLFYTPSQRAQLEAARSRGTRPAAVRAAAEDAAQRYDGVLIRSDGEITRWVDGRATTAAPRGLQPGQTRAGGKVFESYQLLPPAPTPPEERTP